MSLDGPSITSRSLLYIYNIDNRRLHLSVDNHVVILYYSTAMYIALSIIMF